MTWSSPALFCLSLCVASAHSDQTAAGVSLGACSVSPCTDVGQARTLELKSTQSASVFLLLASFFAPGLVLACRQPYNDNTDENAVEMHNG